MSENSKQTNKRYWNGISNQKHLAKSPKSFLKTGDP